MRPLASRVPSSAPVFMRSSSPRGARGCGRRTVARSPKRRGASVSSPARADRSAPAADPEGCRGSRPRRRGPKRTRSEEHTSELQSRFDLVCRLLLEKKKKKKKKTAKQQNNT